MKAAVGLLFAAAAASGIEAAGTTVNFKNIGLVVNKHNFSSGSWDVDGSGSKAYSCDEICPTEYKPVCGTDGVTYDNECAFTVAKCNATDLALASKGKCSEGSSPSSTAGNSTSSCPDACLDVYDPVSDDHGVTYSNQCYMKMAKCKGKKKPTDLLAEYKSLYGSDSGSAKQAAKPTKAPAEKSATPTPNKTAKPTKAVSNQSNVVSSSSRSECSAVCPDIYSPVCGSDKVMYNNPCKLEAASCKNPKLKIHEVSEDQCPESTSTSTTQQSTVTKKTTTTAAAAAVKTG